MSSLPDGDFFDAATDEGGDDGAAALTPEDVQAALAGAAAAAVAAGPVGGVAPEDAVAIAMAAVEPLPAEEETDDGEAAVLDERPPARRRRGRPPKSAAGKRGKAAALAVAEDGGGRTTRSRAAKTGSGAGAPPKQQVGKKKRGRTPKAGRTVKTEAPKKKRARRSPPAEAADDDEEHAAAAAAPKKGGKAGKKLKGTTKKNKKRCNDEDEEGDDDDDLEGGASSLKPDPEPLPAASSSSQQQQPLWEVMFYRLVLYKARHRTTAVPIKFRDDGTAFGDLGAWVTRQRREYFKLPAADRRRYEKMAVEGDVADKEYVAKADRARKEGEDAGEVSKETVAEAAAEKAGEAEGVNATGASAVENIDAVVDGDGATGKTNEGAPTKNVDVTDALPRETEETGADPGPSVAVATTVDGGPDIKLEQLDAPAPTKKRKKGRPPVPPELTPDRISALLAVGFHFSVREDRWEERFKELLAFRSRHGHCNVPTAKSSLGKWVNEQRVLYQRERDFLAGKRTDLAANKRKRGVGFVPRITSEKRERLESIGFKWRLKDRTKFENRLTELVAFRDEHGHTFVPQHYAFNKPLGKWVTKMRYEYGRLAKNEKSQITPARVEQLEEVGFEWSAVKGSGCPNVQNRGRKPGDTNKNSSDVDVMEGLNEEGRAKHVAAQAEKLIDVLDAHRDEEAEKEAAFEAGEAVEAGEKNRKAEGTTKRGRDARSPGMKGPERASEDLATGLAQAQQLKGYGGQEEGRYRYGDEHRAAVADADSVPHQSVREREDPYRRYQQEPPQPLPPPMHAMNAGAAARAEYGDQQRFDQHQHHNQEEADLLARAAAMQADLANYHRHRPEEQQRGGAHHPSQQQQQQHHPWPPGPAAIPAGGPPPGEGAVAEMMVAPVATAFNAYNHAPLPPLQAAAPAAATAAAAAAGLQYMGAEEYGRGSGPPPPHPPGYYGYGQ